jgi:hypothetical protein
MLLSCTIYDITVNINLYFTVPAETNRLACILDLKLLSPAKNFDYPVL